MKAKLYILSICLFSLAFASCKKEHIKLYNNDNYIQFTQSYLDTLNFSFFFHPGKNEVRVGIPLRMIGKVPEQNLGYSIQVDKKASDAPDYIYALPENSEYDIAVAIDTLFITVKNHASLATKEYKLVLEIKDNGKVKPGQTTYTRRIIKISDLISKPIWWDAEMDRFYLGTYSELKFRAFMAVTGIGDLTGIDQSERRIYMLQFKYYLIDQKEKGTPLLLEDGADMLASVPVVG